MSFCHLHTHSEYSALDGLIRIDEAFRSAAERGETALAITDHGTLGGLWKAQKSASAHGVKLIPGCEVYLAFGDRKDRDSELMAEGDLADDSDRTDEEVGKAKRRKYQHLTLLASSPEGWRNLVIICNQAELTKYGKYPRIDYALLKEHAAGILVLTGCLGGPVLGPLSRGAAATAETNLLQLVDAVGHDNVYVEIMEHGIAEETAILPAAAALAEKYDLPLVATNDAHHTRAEDATTHGAWLALRSNTVLSDDKRYQFTGTGYHLRSEAEMRELRPEPWWQEAVSNTTRVADRVADRVLPYSSPKMPVFPTPDGFASNLAYYMHLIKEASARVYGETMPEEVRARLNTELALIQPMGFVDYFLIVHEVVSWARANGILVGPGRGSAAGSLTAYLLGITSIDPLENHLLFERFLEEGRSDFPDIDIDFEARRRNDVLDHLAEKWGKDNVALIGSYGASKTKRAINDAARVLELPAIGSKLSALVPVDQGKPLGFDQLLDVTVASAADFRKQLKIAGEAGQQIIELARGFDEAVNGVSIHACGVVISDRPLTDLIPLRVHPATDRYITTWDGKDVEDFGLCKLDVLGLRNLDIAVQAAKYIQETSGEIINLDALPHPNTQGDPRVDAAWRLLREGRNSGIFQMESPAMTNLARQVQPESLTDLSAVIALFRPGPLSAGMDQHFALRKSGQEAVDYGIFTSDPTEQALLATVLGDTYGTFVFQEQIMRLGTVIAGFDAAARSNLRRAVGKKDLAKMEAAGRAFRAGAVEEFRDPDGTVISPRFSQSTADRVWETIEGCGSYLFNASHSAAYAQLAYMTAYLKANWPGSYGAAILTVTDAADKRIEALRALPEEGIEILPPDVNISHAHSVPEGPHRVRLGLAEIKDVGTAGERIVEVREADGRPFESFGDLVHRVRRGAISATQPDMGHLPSNQLEALIQAGALDQFGPRMGLYTVSRVIKEDAALPVPDLEWGIIEQSARQRSKLLVSLGDHPLLRFQQEITAWNRPGLPAPDGQPFKSPATPIGKLPSDAGATVTTIGILSQFAESSYRGGRKATIGLEGSAASIKGIMWDKQLAEAKESGVIPPIGWPIALGGRISVREHEVEGEDGEFSVTVSRELTVDKMFPVHLDDPVTGTMLDTQVTNLEECLATFSTMPDPEQPVPVPPVNIDLFDDPIVTTTAIEAHETPVQHFTVRAGAPVSITDPDVRHAFQAGQVSPRWEGNDESKIGCTHSITDRHGNVIADLTVVKR